MKSDQDAPWFKYYDGVQIPYEFVCDKNSMYELVASAANRFPDYIAVDYMGKKILYKDFIKNVNHVSSCLHHFGIRKGDCVLVCLPNIPQALYLIYALNRCGAVAVVIHPLSAKNELKNFANQCNCHLAFTYDALVPKFLEIKNETPLYKIVVTPVKEEMSLMYRIGYNLTEGKKDPDIPDVDSVLNWKEFCGLVDGDILPKISHSGDDPAMILYSGGTTGSPKGVVLSNDNMNYAAMGTIGISDCLPCRFEQMYNDDLKQFLTRDGYEILSVMPIFHGFGFGVGVHAFLSFGGKCILVPRFTPDSFAKLIVKHKPAFLAGVPTLYEHMIKSKHIQKADLSFFKGVFVGGDSLSVETRERVDKFFIEHNCKNLIREGYGLTECVTVTCLSPRGHEKAGVIGIPMPNIRYGVFKKGTDKRVPYGKEGEICICGPCNMLGYKNNPKETAMVLWKHSDGNVWLHTGDLGRMSSDGMISFKQRYKRIIISSGYNVYPIQIENIINEHPDVECSCVIGVPDPLRVHIVKAYIQLKKKSKPSQKIIDEIKSMVKDSVSKYSVPRQYEFIETIPRTNVAKIDYRELEKREEAKLKRKKSNK